MKISEIKDILKAEVLAGNDNLDNPVVAASGRLYINGLRGLDGSC